MNMLRVNPFREFDSLFNAYNRSIANDKKTATTTEWMPSVDILEDEQSFIIKAELAGVPKENIKVQIDNNVLSLSGERRTEINDEKQHRIERFYGSFSRQFSLPDNVDETAIKAESKDGILKLILPKKTRQETVKQIEIH